MSTNISLSVYWEKIGINFGGKYLLGLFLQHVNDLTLQVPS